VPLGSGALGQIDIDPTPQHGSTALAWILSAAWAQERGELVLQGRNHDV